MFIESGWREIDLGFGGQKAELSVFDMPVGFYGQIDVFDRERDQYDMACSFKINGNGKWSDLEVNPDFPIYPMKFDLVSFKDQVLSEWTAEVKYQVAIGQPTIRKEMEVLYWKATYEAAGDKPDDVLWAEIVAIVETEANK